MQKYYSIKHLTKYKTPIHNALLKYGFQNFNLEILEYCEEDINPTIREQYYFLMLSPEYNILEIAGSSLGFKHSEETLELFKNRIISEETRNNLSLAATGRILTEEDKIKLSEIRKGIKLSDETKARMSAVFTTLRGVKVIVKNINTNEELEFTSLTEAGKYIGVTRPAIRKYIDTGKPIKNQYIVATKL